MNQFPMTTIKTSELSGSALDWAVAKCECDELAALNIQFPEKAVGFPKISPSTDWSQGGPIIERENITIIRANNIYGKDDDGFYKSSPNWFAETDTCVGHSLNESYENQNMEPTFMIPQEDGKYGPTPLVAAMRCYVAHKMGDTMDVPANLIAQT